MKSFGTFAIQFCDGCYQQYPQDWRCITVEFLLASLNSYFAPLDVDDAKLHGFEANQ